jgi:4-hydroxy-tetrahydrodipicolinate synthase
MADLSDLKQWAKANYRGVENSIKPSFSSDFKTLDESGIRHDIEQTIRHGFFATFCASPSGTPNEIERFLKIATEEARGRIFVGMNGLAPTIEESLDLLARGERAGCTHALVGFPRAAKADTNEDVERYFRTLSEATNLGLVLYATPNPGLRHLDPSGIPIRAFERVADAPNVIAMKLTQTMNPAVAFTICERLAEKILIGPADLDSLPLLAKQYAVQWTGQWIVEAVQSPDKPYIVDLMEALNERRFDRAMELYWQMEPAYRLVHRLQAPLLAKGGHPWAHMRYFQWCVGGNGGLERDPKQRPDQVSVLDAAGRALIRDTYAAIGITIDEPDDDVFVVGRAAWAKGIRKADLSETPLYI